jgi:hypothetical protein
MTRPRTDVRKADLLQELADGALMVDDAEALLDHPFKIGPTPAHHAVLRPVRPGLDDLGEGRQLFRRQPWRMALRADVLQPVRTLGVEAMHPVAQRLPVHPPDPRGGLPSGSVHHRRQRQQARAWLACFEPAARRRSSTAK